MKNHKEHLVQAGYKPSYAAMKTRLEARDCASGRLAPAPGGAAGQAGAGESPAGAAGQDRLFAQ